MTAHPSNAQKFTPGPWYSMNSHKSGFQNVWSLGSDDQPQERKVIVEVPPSDTTIADAQLIAASPAMLAALEEIAALLDCGNIDESHWQDCLGIARAAISKATTP